MNNIILSVARRTGFRPESVKAVAELLDGGATVPFISRYRKEQTGSMDEVQIRSVESALKIVHELEARKEFVWEGRKLLCPGFPFCRERQVGLQCREVIERAVADASKRLLRPSVENEISTGLKEEADRVAIDIFSDNLRQLLLTAPLKGVPVLAIDPGHRTG